MEQEDGFQSQHFKNNIILPPTLHRVSTHKSERQRQVLQIGDVWIPFLLFPQIISTNFSFQEWRIYFELETRY
jgi:hypothetical protein